MQRAGLVVEVRRSSPQIWHCKHGIPEGRHCRDHLSHSSYRQETYSVSQEGREMVLERGGGHLFDLTLVKKVKSWSSGQGGKRLGYVERNECFK